MKSLLKIIRRYIVTAVLITMSVFILNSCLIMFVAYRTSEREYKENHENSSRSVLSAIGEAMQEKDGDYVLSTAGYELLEKSGFVWAMLIDGAGDTVWSWRLPAEIPQSYTMADVSVLSKWYIKDYPVRTWTHEDGFMVYAQNKETISKINGEFSVNFVMNLPKIVLIWMVANIFLVIGLALFLGYRFYRSLRPLAYGIEGLSRQDKITLSEKGMTEELARKLNKTSKILEEKNEKLTQRDNARTDWIAGVSHDIRTPLALIMGYAAGLAADEKLEKEQRVRAASIEQQSLTIKKMIEDLNLTSKLTYNSQPLRIDKYSPARLMRDIVAEYYNNGLEDKYEINLVIKQDVEAVTAQGDVELLKRCFRNIIGNCIRHNKDGCFINIKTKSCVFGVEYLIQDSGMGIKESVVHVWETDTEAGPTGEAPHVMGLRVVSQIVLAHQGKLEFVKRPSGNYDVRIQL